MKKLLMVFVAAIVLSGCSTKPTEGTGKEKLTVATSPDYAPYEFINPNAKDGELKYLGADIELAKYIAEKMDKELVIQAVDFTTIPSAIQAKKYDMGISGFTYDKPRAEIIDFSMAYDSTESACQGILLQKVNEDKYEKLSDLNDKKIAVQNASAQLTYVDEQLPGATKQMVASLNDAILQLKTGKVDAVAISCASGETVVSSNSDLVLSDINFEINPDDGTMVIVPKNSPELLEEVNKIIEEVKEQGLYQKWFEEAKEQAKELGIE